MTPEERADELLKITPESLEKFLNEHQEIVKILHEWFLLRAEALDTVVINHLQHLFGQFLTQAVMLIQAELKAMQRPMEIPCSAFQQDFLSVWRSGQTPASLFCRGGKALHFGRGEVKMEGKKGGKMFYLNKLLHGIMN